MNKVKEIIADKVTPISWNLMVSIMIGGALFVAQFLVLGQSGTLMDSKCGTFGGPFVNCSDNESCEGTCTQADMPERSHVCVFDVEGAICDYSGSIEVKVWSGNCAENPDEYDTQNFCSCYTSGKPRRVRMLNCFT